MTRRSTARALGTVALALSAARPTGAQTQPTLQERLGHSKDARLVIVHADDLGEWHAVNAAAIRAFETGLVSSGAAMPACPWFPEIAAWSREHPEADLGLHLAVTSERTAYRWARWPRATESRRSWIPAATCSSFRSRRRSAPTRERSRWSCGPRSTAPCTSA